MQRPAPAMARRTQARRDLAEGQAGKADRRLSFFRLEIAFPGIDRHSCGLVRAFAPQFPSTEPNRVKPLRALAAACGIRVRKHMHAMDVRDDANMPAHIARKAGMPRRVHVAGGDTLANLEPLGRCRRPCGWTAPGESPGHSVSGKDAWYGLRRLQDLACVELSPRDETT